MYRFNLVSLLPLLTSLVNYLSPEENESALITQLPFMPAPFPSKTYSSFIDISESKSIHYVLTESQDNPQSDPLIIWYSGGPGCSSMLGFFTEVGPFSLLDEAVQFTVNEYAWNKRANMLFIDQPAGTGYSIGKTPDSLKNSDDLSTKDNLQTLILFFKLYRQYQSHDVYLAGQSYAGKYVPFLAEAITQHNAMNPVITINLKGFMLGNPSMDSQVFHERFLQDSFKRGLMPKNLENTYERYDCVDQSDLLPCKHVSNLFDIDTHYINEYNIYGKCYYDENAKPSELPKVTPHLKCTYKGPLEAMLNDKEFKQAFNVEKEGVPHWQHCSDILDYDSNASSVLPTYQKLRHKYKILIFSGDTDELLGFVNTMLAVKKLGWETLSQFTQWYLDGEFVGFKWVLDGMTVATLHGAGHMSAAQKPREVQTMVYDFIGGRF